MTERAWPFGVLPRHHFGAILADPPWHWRPRAASGDGRSALNHYDVMPIEDMIALPVEELTCDAGCVLFLWFTWPMLKQALRLTSMWGFDYKTCAFDWMKADNRQIDMFFGDVEADMKMGYWTRSNSEACLLATRGAPKRNSAGVRMGIIEPAREHSRKPDCVHERIERLVDGPYVELFARRTVTGWSAWGNEVNKFSTPGSNVVAFHER